MAAFEDFHQTEICGTVNSLDKFPILFLYSAHCANWTTIVYTISHGLFSKQLELLE